MFVEGWLRAFMCPSIVDGRPNEQDKRERKQNLLKQRAFLRGRFAEFDEIKRVGFGFGRGRLTCLWFIQFLVECHFLLGIFLALYEIGEPSYAEHAGYDRKNENEQNQKNQYERVSIVREELIVERDYDRNDSG